MPIDCISRSMTPYPLNYGTSLDTDLRRLLNQPTPGRAIEYAEMFLPRTPIVAGGITTS